MSMQPSGYGEVAGPRVGEISRRSFMRRMLGVGVGLITLEFLAGTVAFLWPNVRGGLGGRLEVGTAADIVNRDPAWAAGLPLIFQQKIFFVNVPAGKARVEGNGTAATETADPGAEVLALYRKCPHLGCQIPQLCDQSEWFECLCHGSKYTILGEKRDGPAPRGMDRFDVVIENGSYLVDTSAIIDGPPIGTDTFDSRIATDIPHCVGV